MATISLPTTNCLCNNLTVNGTLTYALLQNKFLQCINNGSQAIPGSTGTVINFGTTSINTFGTDLTIANGNTFTYNGVNPKVWLIQFSVRSNNVTTTAGNIFNIWIQKNGATPLLAQQLVTTNQNGGASFSCGLSTSAPILMNNGDYFQCFIFATTACTISANNTSTQSTLTLME